MADPLSTQIAQAIMGFISATLTAGVGEIGKLAATDVYEKMKKIFTSESQRTLLGNLAGNPDSAILREAAEDELIAILSQSNSFSKEAVFVLHSMSVDAAILETMFKSYKKLKYEYELIYINWANSTSDGEDDLGKMVFLEKKMHLLFNKTNEILGKSLDNRRLNNCM